MSLGDQYRGKPKNSECSLTIGWWLTCVCVGTDAQEGLVSTKARGKSQAVIVLSINSTNMKWTRISSGCSITVTLPGFVCEWYARKPEGFSAALSRKTESKAVRQANKTIGHKVDIILIVRMRLNNSEIRLKKFRPKKDLLIELSGLLRADYYGSSWQFKTVSLWG